MLYRQIHNYLHTIRCLFKISDTSCRCYYHFRFTVMAANCSHVLFYDVRYLYLQKLLSQIIVLHFLTIFNAKNFCILTNFTNNW